MPKWDKAVVQRFVAAESAIVGRQLSLAGTEKAAWAGWRSIGKGVFDDYPSLLVEERSEEITALAAKL